jgi:F-type H+-transporting ATPase subunit b
MSMRVVNTAAFVLAVIAMALFSACGAFAADESPATEESHTEASADHDHEAHANDDAHAGEGHEADAGGHGDGHGGEPNLNPLDWNEMKADLGIWTGVIFVLLLLVLGKFAWGPIADGLDKRESRIAGEIEAAEKANSDAKAQLEEYQQKLAAAGDEVRQLIEQAKRDAESVGQGIEQKARDAADAEKRRAEEDIKLATAGALKEMAEQSANLAVDLAGKIVQQRLSAEDHSALINDAVAKFSKLEPGQN